MPVFPFAAIVAVALLALCRCSGALAQADAAGGKAPACAAAEHRQFDFWLGEWDVRDPDGKPVGRNRIESAHGGCALIEHWSGAGGVSGTSLSIYDRDRARWHQTWVDSGGGLLMLDGSFTGGAMVLAGEAQDDSGKPALQRVTWRTQPDGGVRQLWEASNDGGKRWTVVFDGRYRRQ